MCEECIEAFLAATADLNQSYTELASQGTLLAIGVFSQVAQVGASLPTKYSVQSAD